MHGFGVWGFGAGLNSFGFGVEGVSLAPSLTDSLTHSPLPSLSLSHSLPLYLSPSLLLSLITFSLSLILPRHASNTPLSSTSVDCPIPPLGVLNPSYWFCCG